MAVSGAGSAGQVPGPAPAGGDITVVKRGLYAHHPHGVEVDETTIRDFFCGTAKHVKGGESN